MDFRSSLCAVCTDSTEQFMSNCCCILQWLFLIRVFDDADMYRRLDKHAEEFLGAHIKFVVRILNTAVYVWLT